MYGARTATIVLISQSSVQYSTLMSSRLVALGIVLAATASAAELKVTQYDGPTECDEANKVKSGDLLGMHYTGTIVCSFFSTHHLAFACGACPTAAH